MVRWLDPQPESGALPSRFPSPFDDVAPHALAQRCAELLMTDLGRGFIAPGVPTSTLYGDDGGKMFGVLVVRGGDGRVGFLSALSGQLGRAWLVEGYVPPVFDAVLRDAVEPPAEVVVKALTARSEAARTDPALHAARAALSELERRQAAERAALKVVHAEKKKRRRALRAQGEGASGRGENSGSPTVANALEGGEGRRENSGSPTVANAREGGEGRRENSEVPLSREVGEGWGEGSLSRTTSPSLSAAAERSDVTASPNLSAADTSDAGSTSRTNTLDDESRADDRERRALEARFRDERAAATSVLKPLERHLAALDRLRPLVSREAMRRIWDSYVLRNAAGETTTLRALFPNGDPPSGAGDCAAPKLLMHAHRLGLTPLALAEFWWGAPPPAGARVEGMYFPACKEKCAPILPFLLNGLDVAPRQTWKPLAHADDALPVIHRDPRFLVLNKPSGMLSVPARDESVTDSLLARVRATHPQAMTVHRLDLDTSGLLLVALDEDTYRALQRQFLERTVHKQYVAVLSRELAEDEGTIELPLRVDLEQRPRQVVDFTHGKSAVTRWKVLSRSNGRTRVAFFPITGRTHQLRVHAAHRDGLNAPIVGDRLYGEPSARLLLHAEVLSFRHPVTGEVLTVTAPAPF